MKKRTQKHPLGINREGVFIMQTPTPKYDRYTVEHLSRGHTF